MISVTRALILQNGRLLAAQRPETMSLPLKWELPGGKLKPGEELEDCLRRETMEELNLEIRPLERMEPVFHSFRDRIYQMIPYLSEIISGDLIVREHKAIQWVEIDAIFDLDWAPAEEKMLREWLIRYPQNKPVSSVTVR